MHLEVVANDDEDKLKTTATDLHELYQAGMQVIYSAVAARYYSFKREKLHCQLPYPLKWSSKTLQLIECGKDFRSIALTEKMPNILNIIDVHSKYIFAFAMQAKSAENVTRLLEKLFSKEGRHSFILQTDNEKECVNARVVQL